MIGLTSLISGATSGFLSKLGKIETAMDKMYESSPLGKFEESFKDSGIHKAFSGSDGSDSKFTFGGNGGMSHASLQPLNISHTDGVGDLQGVMSQGGILNPAANLLQGGAAPVNVPAANLYTPRKIQVAPAPSQSDAVLAEVDRIEAEADKEAKRKQGLLQENNPALLSE